MEFILVVFSSFPTLFVGSTLTDFSIKVIADELGKSLSNLPNHIENEVNRAVGELAHATHAGLITQVQAMSRDPKNRMDYLNGLDLNKIGNNAWVITLDGEWANKLEEGFASYSIKDVLLRSKKMVSVGSRAGQPWVRTAKDGHKWAVVPFEHKPYSGEKKSGDLLTDLKKLRAKNRSGEMQPFLDTFKDRAGNPLQGKVAVADVPLNKNLQGLTKFQHTYEKTTSSVYMTFRIVSEKSNGWQHPGFRGYQLFKQAEIEVERELKNIVNLLL